MIEEHVSKDAAATLAVQAVPANRTRYGGLACPADPAEVETGSFSVADILEKPGADTLAPGWDVAARFVFSPAIFAAIRRTRPGRGGETLLTDAVRTLLRQGKTVRAVCLTPEQKRHDVGSFGGYYRAFLEYALADPYFSQEVRACIEEALARDQGWEGEEQC
jgi:UTP--glucose-1-phosphate uridylyltransferase